MSAPHIAVRGDLDGFALYFEEPDAAEPGEFIAVFPTSAEASAAKRAATAITEALGSL